MEKIVIIGTGCSGKSRLAKRLAASFGVPRIELDALHWKPGWQERMDDEFICLAKDSITGGGWIVDGNYAVTREIVWPQASLITG